MELSIWEKCWREKVQPAFEEHGRTLGGDPDVARASWQKVREAMAEYEKLRQWWDPRMKRQP